jgi:hypothetical protein
MLPIALNILTLFYVEIKGVLAHEHTSASLYASVMNSDPTNNMNKLRMVVCSLFCVIVPWRHHQQIFLLGREQSWGAPHCHLSGGSAYILQFDQYS